MLDVEHFSRAVQLPSPDESILVTRPPSRTRAGVLAWLCGGDQEDPGIDTTTYSSGLGKIPQLECQTKQLPDDDASTGDDPKGPRSRFARLHTYETTDLEEPAERVGIEAGLVGEIAVTDRRAPGAFRVRSLNYQTASWAQRPVAGIDKWEDLLFPEVLDDIEAGNQVEALVAAVEKLEDVALLYLWKQAAGSLYLFGAEVDASQTAVAERSQTV